jgi:D-3-phosphoglycerate dehydrogenase
MPRIFLTHTPEMRDNYYGARAVAGLRALGELFTHEDPHPLTADQLVAAAAGCQHIVSDRQTPGYGAIFARLPDLLSFSRCAVDIRNVDVAAASAAGVLVTRASAGFMASVSEWIIGAMIDLSRNITASVITYRGGGVPVAGMGRELRNSTVGVIGYGQIARYFCDLALGFRMRVLVADPYAKVDNPALTQCSVAQLLAESDYVVCLAIANEATENLMNAAAFRQMKKSAYFVNASRGNLVDDAALVEALDEGWFAGAALDVGRDPDQMPVLALARHPRIIATPHLAGLTPDAVEHQSLETVRQVGELVAGRIPAGAVNAEHATRFQKMSESMAAGKVSDSIAAGHRV